MLFEYRKSFTHLSMRIGEKTWCLLAVIPILVFDCVALRLRESISGLVFRAHHRMLY